MNHNNNGDVTEVGEDDSVFQRVHEWCSSQIHNPNRIEGTNEIQTEQNHAKEQQET